MFVLFTLADLAAVELMLISVPESLGLLGFGVALIATAVIGRWLLGRGEEEQEEEEMPQKS